MCLRGSVYIASPFICDKNKHVVSDQMYNCPHNTWFRFPMNYVTGISRTSGQMEVAMWWCTHTCITLY